jgi:3-dehydroquinate synthase
VADRIEVIHPQGTYPILFERGAVMQIADHAGAFGLAERTAVVTDANVARLYGDRVVQGLPDSVLVEMPEGEQYKTLDTVAHLYRRFVEAGLDRSSTVVALGGGVVGDTAGFAAATYMRGVRLVQMPTSLLAMVDSSVGGKVGVDLPEGKNLVGAFKQPDLVIIDVSVLATLPVRQFSCGLAEVIKHGLLADPDLLDQVRSLVSSGLDSAAERPDELTAVVRRAVQVKVDIVQKDPFEQNIRAYLNLGHTFGHAIETVSEYHWYHGEAVGIGLVAAARLSAALGLCQKELPDRVEAIVRAAGLPTRMSFDAEPVLAAMATDKKWRAGQSRFILLRDIGQPVIQVNVPREAVLEVLVSLRQ